MTTLDSFAFDDVSFIKIDVEGAELDVLEGARQTVERHRPRLVVELLTKGRGDALAGIRRIEAMLGYRSWLLQDRAWHPAAAAIERLPHIQSNNVVFTPNGDAPARLA